MKRFAILLALLMMLLCVCATAETITLTGNVTQQVEYEGFREDLTIILDHAHVKSGMLFDSFMRYGNYYDDEYPTVTLVLRGDNVIEARSDMAVRLWDCDLVIEGGSEDSLLIKGGQAEWGIWTSDRSVTIDADNVTIRGGDAYGSSYGFVTGGNAVSTYRLNIHGSNITFRGGDAYCNEGDVQVVGGTGANGIYLVVTGDDVTFEAGDVYGESDASQTVYGGAATSAFEYIDITGDRVTMTPGSCVTGSRESHGSFALQNWNWPWQEMKFGGSMIMSGKDYQGPSKVFDPYDWGDRPPVYAAGTRARPLLVEISDDGETWTAIDGNPFSATVNIVKQVENANYIRITVLDPLPDPTPVPTPVPTPAPDVPVTGDDASPALWLCMAVLAACAAMLLRRKAA